MSAPEPQARKESRAGRRPTESSAWLDASLLAVIDSHQQLLRWCPLDAISATGGTLPLEENMTDQEVEPSTYEGYTLTRNEEDGHIEIWEEDSIKFTLPGDYPWNLIPVAIKIFVEAEHAGVRKERRRVTERLFKVFEI